MASEIGRLEIYEEGGLAVARRERTGEVVPFPASGGGGEPVDLVPILARLGGIDAAIAALQASGGGGQAGQLVNLAGLEWRQNTAQSIPPGGPARHNVPILYTGILKTVCQGFHTPGGLSWLTFLIVFGPAQIPLLPEPDPAAGGEWEFKLPFPMLVAPVRERGYWLATASIHNANHGYEMKGTMKAVTYLEDPAGTAWVHARFDRKDVDQPGVVNRRNPFLNNQEWHNGCVYEFTAVYPTQ